MLTGVPLVVRGVQVGVGIHVIQDVQVVVQGVMAVVILVMVLVV